jgi:hypothetical protein
MAAACGGGGDRESPSVSAADAAPDARPSTPGADAGVFGAQHKCYGIADDLGEVFAIEPETGQATHLCSVPTAVAEIDAIASHPVTGVYYYVSQADAELGLSAELGSFSPDNCTFDTIGTISTADLAGLSFHPVTGDLYGGDQTDNTLYRFGRDADGAPTAETTVVTVLPLPPKAIAIQPETGMVYVSDADAIFTVDLSDNSVGEPVPLSVGSVQALFFDQDGQLFGAIDHSGLPADTFVRVDATTGEVTQIGGFNPVLYLPDTTDRPLAEDLEATDCNVGGACSDCVD